VTVWPPDLAAFKTHLLSRGEDSAALDADDAKLQQKLDAAVSEVQRIHRGRYNFDGDPENPRPEPGPGIVLGTLMLAGRWHTRDRSPDGIVEMGELGTSRVPSFDPDIDRLLRIGRHGIPVVG
jgi:hypothetical protein